MADNVLKKFYILLTTAFILIVLVLGAIGLFGSQGNNSLNTNSSSTNNVTSSSGNSSSANSVSGSTSTASSSSTGSAASSANGYTSADVAKHNSSNSCWLIVDGQVYDVTKYLSSGSHPAGSSIITSYCGQDASNVFDSYHNSRGVNTLSQYLIGALK